MLPHVKLTPRRSPSPRSTPFRTFRGDLAIGFDRPQEGAVGFVALGGGNALAAYAPELLDGADAPQGTLAGGTDRLAAHDHIDGVGVHLREVPQGHPATP